MVTNMEQIETDFVSKQELPGLVTDKITKDEVL